MVSPARPEASTTTAYVSDGPAVGARGGAVFSVTMRRDPHDNVMTVAGELDVASAQSWPMRCGASSTLSTRTSAWTAPGFAFATAPGCPS